MKPTYPVPPIDGNVPVLLSWDSKKTRTMVWYGKKATMRKCFQFDEHDKLTAEYGGSAGARSPHVCGGARGALADRSAGG